MSRACLDELGFKLEMSRACLDKVGFRLEKSSVQIRDE